MLSTESGTCKYSVNGGYFIIIIVTGPSPRPVLVNTRIRGGQSMDPVKPAERTARPCDPPSELRALL